MNILTQTRVIHPDRIPAADIIEEAIRRATFQQSAATRSGVVAKFNEGGDVKTGAEE